jgi:hypothetical protein
VPPAIAFHKVKNFHALYAMHAPPKVMPEFIARHVLLATFASLRRGRAEIATHLRGVWWTLRHVPKLLDLRRRGPPPLEPLERQPA